MGSIITLIINSVLLISVTLQDEESFYQVETGNSGQISAGGTLSLQERINYLERHVRNVEKKYEQGLLVISTLKSLLQEKEQQQNSKISVMESKLLALETSVYDILKETMHAHDHGPLVAFEVLARNVIHTKGPVNFQLLTTDFGEAFNIATDNFTIPWTGLYMLSASVNVYINSSVRAELRINGLQDNVKFIGIDLTVPRGKQDFRTGSFTSLQAFFAGDVIDMVLTSLSDIVYIASARLVGYRVK